MKNETLIDHSGDSKVELGHVDLDGRLWAEHDLRVLSVSARTQAQEHSPHPTHGKIPRQSHDPKALEQILSTVIATDGSQHPKIDRETYLVVGNARRHPQNTHALATSCPMCTSEVALMDLDRCTLARIDRKLLARLGDDEAYRTVRVPVSAAKWSIWKRYCDSVGISMGRAVTMLIDRELISVFGEHAGDEPPVFAQRAVAGLAIREAKVGAREREIDAAEERLDGWNYRLRIREGETVAREQRFELAVKLASRPSLARVKVGRNERCPCGSGLKYKRCHGLVVRDTQ